MGKTPSRNDLRSRTAGQWLALAADYFAETAREELAAGVPEEIVRKRIIARAEAEQLTGVRSLFPGLNRKAQRLPLRKLLHMLVDTYFDRHGGMKVRDGVQALLERVGFEEWLVDYVLARARNEEPGAMYPLMMGKVWVQPMGLGGEKDPTVWCVLTPYCDVEEQLAEARALAQSTFPDSTWSRYAANPEAARYFRLSRENLSDAQIAALNLDEAEPHVRDMGEECYRERLKMETARVAKLRKRFETEYMDRFLREVSTDSD